MVTQKQWREVMGTNITGKLEISNIDFTHKQCFEFMRKKAPKGDDLPVEISWNDVQEFIKKLNEMENMKKYRLSSEAEWEYAARAGTTTRYSYGDDESKLGYYAWYETNSSGKTHEVGQKKP